MIVIGASEGTCVQLWKIVLDHWNFEISTAKIKIQQQSRCSDASGEGCRQREALLWYPVS